MTILNSKGEVADFLDVSQFIPGRSAYECVAYSAALIKYCGTPGHGPTGTVQQASNLAQYWYGAEEGGNSASNTNGMSLEAMYKMLGGMGLAWTPCSLGLQGIRQSLIEGRPVMLCGAETGMYDLDLGDRVPYAWTPSGNHCIVISGNLPDGNFLVHDSASIAPSGVRPGPRRYDASKLQIVSSTSIATPWIGGKTLNIPSGWRDENGVLYCPANSGGGEVSITGSFRDYILSNPWPNSNVALEEGHHVDILELSSPANGPCAGSGWQQTFRFAMLGKPDSGPKAGQVIFEWLGVELFRTRSLLTEEKAQVASLTAQITSLQQEVATHPDMAALANRLSAIGMNARQAEGYLTQVQELAAQPLS